MAAHQPHRRLSLDRPRCAIAGPQAASPDARRRRPGETLAYIWVRSMYRPQIEAALTVSKNGVRDLVAALVKAGLAEMTTHRHQAVVRATQPLRTTDPVPVSPDETEAIADTNFAEFDAAMADIDRLLARSNASLREE